VTEKSGDVAPRAATETGAGSILTLKKFDRRDSDKSGDWEMTRRREVGIIKSCVLGAALAVGLATAAQADNKLTLSGSASFVTDYMFRSVSNSNQNPAVQPEFDLTYGIFWAYIWGSNVDFGGTPFGHDVATIEIDYGAGISPKWKDITFTIGGLYYTYPGAYDPAGEFNYFELKTGATYAKGNWTLGIVNYWSPEAFGEVGNQDALEGSLGYTFNGKVFNFFTPTISGLIGREWEETIPSYTYWNAGLTLGFMDHWSADIRYYDTNMNNTECFAFTAVSPHLCDARVVGALKATF
jgi:uncharacterized protein (TIGR02001 family)